MDCGGCNRVPASLAVDTHLNKFPFEMIDPHDVESTAQLLTGFVSVAA